jgi:hypothetical protein
VSKWFAHLAAAALCMGVLSGCGDAALSQLTSDPAMTMTIDGAVQSGAFSQSGGNASGARTPSNAFRLFDVDAGVSADEVFAAAVAAAQDAGWELEPQDAPVALFTSLSKDGGGVRTLTLVVDARKPDVLRLTLTTV